MEKIQIHRTYLNRRTSLVSFRPSLRHYRSVIVRLLTEYQNNVISESRFGSTRRRDQSEGRISECQYPGAEIYYGNGRGQFHPKMSSLCSFYARRPSKHIWILQTRSFRLYLRARRAAQLGDLLDAEILTRLFVVCGQVNGEFELLTDPSVRYLSMAQGRVAFLIKSFLNWTFCKFGVFVASTLSNIDGAFFLIRRMYGCISVVSIIISLRPMISHGRCYAQQR